MKTKNASPVRQLVPAALFLALAFVLPLLTGQVPKVGNMLCPMHFPVLLCGFVLGGPWGLAVGFAAPLLRSVLFGMPPMFPVAISMAFELATYGLVSGLLWRRAKHSLPALYAVLLTAMVSGRIVWGIVRFVLAGLTGGSFPFSAFLSGALFTAVPGIVAQRMSCATMPGTAVSTAPDRNALNGKLEPDRPASTKRTAPQIRRPATIEVTRVA